VDPYVTLTKPIVTWNRFGQCHDLKGGGWGVRAFTIQVFKLKILGISIAKSCGDVL